MRDLLQRFCLLAILAFLAPVALAQDVGVFELHFDAEVFGGKDAEPFDGEVFVAFAAQGEPRAAMHGWFGAPPVMRFAPADVKQGTVLKLRVADAVSKAPMDWSEAQNQKWQVQAVARVSRTGREAGFGEGDVFSAAAEANFVLGSNGVVALHLDQVAEAPLFEETERVRLFNFVSPALTKFHGFDYTMQAGVLLPRNYDASKRYPRSTSASWWFPTRATCTGIRSFAIPHRSDRGGRRSCTS